MPTSLTEDAQVEDLPPQTVGILTGGGNAPGLNAVVSASTQTLKARGHKVLGVPKGLDGLLKPVRDVEVLSDLSERTLRKLLSKAGTRLGSSRTKIEEAKYPEVREVVQELHLDGLIAIGGDDTLGTSAKLDAAGVLPVVGVPKTIDNDLQGTDRTFGFETACHVAAKQLRHMRTEAKSMGRVSFVEIMGRKAGWIALYAGAVAGADITLIREFPIPEDRLMAKIREIYERQGHVFIAVAEGYEHEGKGVADETRKDPHENAKLGGIAEMLELVTQDKTRLETQSHSVGYEVRNHRPTAADAIFAGELGALAGLLAHERKYGQMVALRDGKITSVPLEMAKGGRNVTERYYDVEHMRKWDLPPNIVQTLLDTQRRVQRTVG
ncbi:MAG: ATP-dependent 6-phosphofructokinase [Candidatus Peribacteraceae bacterium]